MTFLPDTLTFEGCESVVKDFGESYSDIKENLCITKSTLQQTVNILSHV